MTEDIDIFRKDYNNVHADNSQLKDLLLLKNVHLEVFDKETEEMINCGYLHEILYDPKDFLGINSYLF